MVCGLTDWACEFELGLSSLFGLVFVEKNLGWYMIFSFTYCFVDRKILACIVMVFFSNLFKRKNVLMENPDSAYEEMVCLQVIKFPPFTPKRITHK